MRCGHWSYHHVVGWGRVTLLAIALTASACTSAGQKGASSTTTTTAAVPQLGRALPRAPISGRVGAGAVWSGTEMIIWGGLDHGDGAAYNPTTDRWRTLGAAPAGVSGVVDRSTAWTGSEAIFVAGNPVDGPFQGAMYNPATDSWRVLPAAPLGPRESHTSVWTGTEFWILGGTNGDTVAKPYAAGFNPRTGTWRTSAALDRRWGTFAHALWTGRDILILGTRLLCPEKGSVCAEWVPAAVAFDPASGHVRDLPTVGNRPDEALVGGWFDGTVVELEIGKTEHTVRRYDPATGVWRTGPAVKCAESEPWNVRVTELGDRFAVPCGPTALAVFDPSRDVWTTRNGASPLSSRDGVTTAWTGSDLLLWGGSERKPGNPSASDGVIVRVPQ